MTVVSHENAPLIAIVGRPNVGKSTLFNRLTRQWKSIVEDREGITRDRIYNNTYLFGYPFRVMDTGGLRLKTENTLEDKMSKQAEAGIREAQIILFVMDGRAGITPLDEDWVRKLRKLKKPVFFLVNKMDNEKVEKKLAYQFEALGVKDLFFISSEKQRSLVELAQEVITHFDLPITKAHQSVLKNPHKRHLMIARRLPPDFKVLHEGPKEWDDAEAQDSEALPEDKPEKPLKISIIGRPNVGKSTLFNALINEQRSIADNTPGTTRDPIDTTIEFDGNSYCFIDTAGIRRQGKTHERVEKFSIVAALKKVDESDVVLLVLDAEQGPTDQDAHVAGYAFEKDKTLIIVNNKWDLGKEKWTREDVEGRMELKMNFLNFCPMLYLSALTGKNVDKVFKALQGVKRQLDTRISTSALNKAFEHMVEHHPLPTYKGREIKMFYATQAATRPPAFLIFCTEPAHVHETYKRYLKNGLRELLETPEIPIKLIFKKRK
jgi:GTP-binding protein